MSGYPFRFRPDVYRGNCCRRDKQCNSTVAEANEIARDFVSTAAMIDAHRGSSGNLAIDADAGKVKLLQSVCKARMRVVAGVMRQGRLLEVGKTDQIFRHTQDPYTIELMQKTPKFAVGLVVAR